MNKIKIVQLTLGIIFLIMGFIGFIQPVKAELNACDFLPCSVNTGQVGENEANILNPDFSLKNLVKTVTSLIFIVFILVGVGIFVKAALAITKSEGDEAQIEKGFTSIKSVFFAVGLIIVGIIGLVAIAALFRAGGIFGTQIEDPEGFNVKDNVNKIL